MEFHWFLEFLQTEILEAKGLQRVKKKKKKKKRTQPKCLHRDCPHYSQLPKIGNRKSRFHVSTSRPTNTKLMKIANSVLAVGDTLQAMLLSLFLSFFI